MQPDNNVSPSGWNSGSASGVNGKPKWTVMVFMGADKIDGNEPLDEAAKADIDEIAFSSAEPTPDAPTLDIFVQVHRSTGATQRLRFGRNPEEPRPIPDQRPGEALINFIEDSILTSKHRRGDHSMLVLWGHAYDFAFGRSRTREGTVDSIDFIELSTLLERLQDRILTVYQKGGDPTNERPTLDIVGFDACDVATVEMAYQLHPFAKYLLGSEIGIPIPGWPYDRILDRLRDPKGRPMTPPEFGSYVVRRFCESYPASSPVSLTFLDLAKATELRHRGKILALALLVAIADSDERDRTTELFTQSRTGDGRPFVDVADLCLNLVRHSGDALVVEAARAVGDLLLNPDPPCAGKSAMGKGRPFIVDHGRNAGELARLNGISLYAPHVALDSEVDAARQVYDRFVFAQETVWSQLVHTLATRS